MIPIPPQAAAAVAQTAASIVGKAERAILGIFDPGQKRDANREARAEMWYQFANGGSITAARRLHGGSVVQYTSKERGFYATRWAKFQAAKPPLAQQALQLGDLGIPEPGSDTTPPSLPPDMIQQLQAEMDAYAAHQGGAAPASSTIVPNVTTAPASSSAAIPTPVLIIGGALVLIVVLALVVGHPRR